MAASKKNVVWYILGSIAFLALPLLLSQHPPEEIDWMYSRPTLRDFISNALILIFFFLNYFILIPKLYFTREFFLYGLCLVVSFLIICLVPSLALGRVPALFSSPTRIPFDAFDGRPPQPENSSFLNEIKHEIYLFVSVALFSVLLRVRGRLLQTEEAKHNAEINSLKSQVNPHFLFNTLNSIYAFAIREKASSTATGILKLSGMMRYVVTETGNGLVTLQKEISYINDYVELQRLRLDKRVDLSYSVTGNIRDQTIAPLLLIPFIENAFKHGVNPDEDSSLNIIVEADEKQLKLIVENKKVNVTMDPHMESGKGIENAKLRLQLLYPARHFLILNEDESHFRVQLTIQLV